MTDYGRREAAMCRDYMAGFNSPQIAAKHGITRERVRQILKPHGLIAARQKQRAEKRMEKAAEKRAYWYEFDLRVQDGVEMVDSGVSIAKACRATRVSYTALRSALEQRGVKSIHSKWRDETIVRQRIPDLIDEGKNARQIKKALDDEKLRVSIHWIYANFGDVMRARRRADLRFGVLAVNEAGERIPANDNNPAQEQEAA